jgi:hypothetical protein
MVCHLLAILFLLFAPAGLEAQSITGIIRGTIRDGANGIVRGATVMAVNVDTHAVRLVHTDENGAYLILNVAVGEYQLKAEATGFTTVVRSGVTLSIGQTAVVDMSITPAAVHETIEVRADAPPVNRSNAEVGTRFDRTRVAELPVRGSRNVYALALSAPGVAELASGQTEFAGENRTGLSVNGMRLRSNNWMIDGQDNIDPNAGNRHLTINNTEIVQEVRLTTSQFPAEVGRGAGSVVNVITRSGTNTLRGALFLFHNDNTLNSRSNLDKSAGRTAAPYRDEKQYGGALGGRIIANRTFYFGSFQRWTNRQLGSGTTLDGAPTESGREILAALAGDRPHVRALLEHLPAGTPNGRSVTVRVDGRTAAVPLGSLTGSAPLDFENHQASFRIDHQATVRHAVAARYLLSRTPRNSGGDVQVTPSGLTSNNPTARHALSVWGTSTFGSSTSNELRVAWSRVTAEDGPEDARSLEIPSIEIVELGMTGSLKTRTRTAIGLASNLPNSRTGVVYQLQNTLAHARGSHLIKAGFDIRAQTTRSFVFPAARGLLRYATLHAFVADVAESAGVNTPLPGGERVNHYKWWEHFYFIQDEWRVGPDVTLNFGLRYEVPGNTFHNLITIGERIQVANGNDPAFGLRPVPTSDVDNVQPRIGFNWAPNQVVIRGGYARTHDHAFLNIPTNVASSFPFVAAHAWGNLPNAFAVVQSTPDGLPAGSDPNQLARTIVAEDFRSPSADQFSLDAQRQVFDDVVFRVGYVGTFGRSLFQTLDGNPRLPFSADRVDPAKGAIRMRANTARSWYHSLQFQLDKRLGQGVSAGVHYTWSRFEDTASDIFNTSVSEVAIAQDSFDPAAERARSSYDRPHRLAGNLVWELPLFRDQRGVVGKALGGWQVGAFFMMQSGAPFTVLNGADPTGALAGIDALVGNAIRPNLNTSLELSKMTIEEIRAAGGARLFRPLCGFPRPGCAGERVGNVPRNSLRSDGLQNVDLAIIKTIRLARAHAVQLRIEMFNATNTRNFGVPDGRINSANFLNQWATDGGSRRIWAALRYTF